MAPKYHGASVSARPVKERFGRPGTCTQDTSQLTYQTKSQGAGMTKMEPMAKARVRQVNSRISKSMESAPPP